MQTIRIPVDEYLALIDELAHLKNNPNLDKIYKLVDLLYKEKYGFYMGDFTDDLTEVASRTNWDETPSEWDKV